MTGYVRFKIPEIGSPLATVATLATVPPPSAPSVATVASVARQEPKTTISAPADDGLPDDTPEAWRCWRLSWVQGLAERHPRSEAERLTWAKAENAWHRRHGTAPHRSICGGCGEPIGDRNAIPLGDGAQVHWDAAGVDCLIDYGKRWRGSAYAGLVRLGLTPPGEARSYPPDRPV